VPLRAYSDDLATSLLRHLGHVPSTPSVENLTRLQHAFLDTVPYENLEIQLGRPTTIDPVESARRIVGGRGGYCFHLNGVFASLLVSLGYEVTLARGKVTGRDDSELGHHMVVMVHIEGTTWMPDVGLGDGYRDPIPVQEGIYDQPPFTYGLRKLCDDRWQLRHDERATIDGVDFDPTPVSVSAFEPNHAHLSTSPDSSFVRKLVVQQRRADHTLILRGCLVLRTDAEGVAERVVPDQDQWWRFLADEFGLCLDDVTSAERDGLWRRTRTRHDEWEAAGRP
jgi:arylamine N-acetyltransferase